MTYYDELFKLTKIAKVQQKLLNVVHSLTGNVIKEKWKDIEEKGKKGTQNDEIQKEESNANENTKNGNYMNLHYVRDDLDEIDENDVGEKKRLAFLEALMDMKKNNEQMSDEEIWEEVNTIMFEVNISVVAVMHTFPENCRAAEI